MRAVHETRRWLYRGKRPHRLARLLNAVQANLAARSIGPARIVALEVTGRHTGRAVMFPLVVADYEGERYLVSMFGERANWVRNVRAGHGEAVLRHRGRQLVHLEEVPPAERGPILRRYLERAPGARPHIPVALDAPAADFERLAPTYPVFRITVPRATPQGSQGRPVPEAGARFLRRPPGS